MTYKLHKELVLAASKYSPQPDASQQQRQLPVLIPAGHRGLWRHPWLQHRWVGTGAPAAPRRSHTSVCRGARGKHTMTSISWGQRAAACLPGVTVLRASVHFKWLERALPGCTWGSASCHQPSLLGP